LPDALVAGMTQTAAVPADAALRLTHGGVRLRLLAQRAVLIEEHRALLVADVHLGKAASFRALGVPVPEATTQTTLARLGELLALHAPQILCVLGDLLHAPASQAPLVIDALASWRARHAGVRVLLVRGNHDDRAGDPPPHCGIEVVDEPFMLGGLALCHVPPQPQIRALPGERGAASTRAEPECSPAPSVPTHALAGHLHPVTALASRHDRIRLACFLLERNCLVLPAFGEFTGGWPVDASADAQVFPTDGERVYRLPQRAARAARMR
jgi:DNA ligase-associated metallophosphoesterase